jgi:hypothetical protein
MKDFLIWDEELVCKTIDYSNTNYTLEAWLLVKYYKMMLELDRLNNAIISYNYYISFTLWAS